MYTLDFFELCRRRLTPDGMVVAWVPIDRLAPDVIKSVFKTFNRAFPHSYLWYFNNYYTQYVLLLGRSVPLRIDIGTMFERINEPLVKRDLMSINLDNPYKMLSCFVTDREYLERFSEGAILNTENHPYVEFHSPRMVDYSGETKAEVLRQLMAGRRPVADYLVNLPDDVARVFHQKMQRYFDAAPFILHGHSLMDLGHEDAARDAFGRAREINPDDASVLGYGATK